MPFINLRTNATVSAAQKDALKSAFGKAICTIPGKSENWLMVGIEPEQALYFQGNNAPAAMVEVSIYGSASAKVYDKLTAQICSIVGKELAIDAARIYVKYAEIEYWGWNGSNF